MTTRYIDVQKQHTRHLVDPDTATVLCDPRLWYTQPVDARAHLCRGCEVAAKRRG